MKKRLETEFEYFVTKNHRIVVKASAERVKFDEADDLVIELFSRSGEEYDQILDEETSLDLEEQAISELAAKKYELKFRS